MKLSIDVSERLVAIAKTGGGKTEWAKYMLRLISQKMPVVIVDPNFNWLGKYPIWEKERKQPGTIDKPHLIDRFNPKWHVQCLQPDTDGSEPDERLEHLCWDVFKHGNIFIYFDETEGIATATSVPKYIRVLWKRGRSHGIGAWAATQAPSGIPRIFKSQAEKFVVFKVGDQDARLVAEIVHSDEEEVKGLGRFEWLYYDNKSMDYAEWNPPIPFEERKIA